MSYEVLKVTSDTIRGQGRINVLVRFNSDTTLTLPFPADATKTQILAKIDEAEIKLNNPEPPPVKPPPPVIASDIKSLEGFKK